MEVISKNLYNDICDSNIEYDNLYVKITLANCKDQTLVENYREISIVIPRRIEQLEKDFEYLDNRPYIIGCKFIEKGYTLFAVKLSEIVEETIENEEVNLQDISKLYGVIKKYDYISQMKLLAILEEKETQISTIDDIIKCAKNLKDYNLLPNINNLTDMGKYLVEETGHFDEVSLLSDYIDYEQLAQDYTKNGCVYDGTFTKYGYLMKKEELQKEQEEEEEFGGDM